MKVRVNGTERDLDEGLLLADLLSSLGLSGGVVVELNLEVVRPDRLGKVALKDGDSIELVRFVGGG